MKKAFLLAVAALVSSSALANSGSVNSTINGIESNRNAKCEYSRSSSIGLGFGMYRWSKKYFYCSSNAGDFRVALKVREEIVDYEYDSILGGHTDPGSFGMGQGRRAIYGNTVVTNIMYY